MAVSSSLKKVRLICSISTQCGHRFLRLTLTWSQPAPEVATTIMSSRSMQEATRNRPATRGSTIPPFCQNSGDEIRTGMRGCFPSPASLVRSLTFPSPVSPVPGTVPPPTRPGTR